MGMSDRRTADFASHFAHAYPGRTAVMVVLLMLAGLAEALGLVTLLPVLQIATGEGKSGNPVVVVIQWLGLEPELAVLLGAIVVALLLKAGFRLLAMRQVGYTLARVGRDLRVRLMKALMQVRWLYFTSQPEGQFANAISTEAYRAAMAYKHVCAALASAIQVLVYASVIVVISWKVAVFALIVGGIAALILSRFVRLSRRAGWDQTSVLKSMVASLTDALKGIKSIKAMGQEEPFLGMLEERAALLEESEQRQVLAHESLQSFQEPLIAIMLALGIYGALTLGSLPLSELLVMAFLFYRLTGRFHEVQREYQLAATGESAFWSLYDTVREAENQEEENFGSNPPPPLKHELIFDSVTFAYGDSPILRNVTFRIPAGKFTALVGTSGAGKTTIVDLIAGLHRPQSGHICVDGVRLADIDMKAWRSMIGYVPQDTLLFHDSVFENVRLGRSGVTPNQVESALIAADAWGFVSRLPNGMHTVIGERGAKISGGQRQRVAIARALLHEPVLLILDEATTALDPATEKAICDTLIRLRDQVTVLAISHQNALQNVADLTFEVAGGRVAKSNFATEPVSSSAASH